MSLPRFIISVFLCLLSGAGFALAKETPHIVVTIKPVHAIVSALLKDISHPDLLLKGLSSPHSYHLKPSDAQTLHTAGLIIWVGPTLEGYLSKPIALQEGRAEVMRLMDYIDTGNTKHPEHERDAHFWLDPLKVIQLIAPLQAVLLKQFPGKVDIIKKNAGQLEQTLKQLDISITQRFNQRYTISAIVYHDAWQYFLMRYGLRIQGIVSTHEQQQPGPAHLYQLQQDIRNKSIQCLLIEPQYRPGYLKSLVADNQLKLVRVDPLGATVTPGPSAYATIMLQITGAFTQCLAD